MKKKLKMKIHANMFCFGSKKPEPRDVSLITHIANKNGAGFIQLNDHRYEYCFYFTHWEKYPNNKTIAKTILNELLCEGIDLELDFLIRRPDFDNVLASRFFSEVIYHTLQSKWAKSRLEDMLGEFGRDSFTVRFWLKHKFGFKFPYRHFNGRIKMDKAERLQVACDDADEVLKKLEEFDASFLHTDNRKEFRKWLIEKMEAIMVDMEDDDDEEEDEDF